LDPVQLRIWEALGTARHADELARELSLPAEELSRHLTKMDIKKAVTRLPGNRYERR
jgi:predicted Rossmann fold nucleotide-binding protein DprA/Smf involved in DNA uptake